MRRFDYSFLKRISTPADILNSATSIYEMKARAKEYFLKIIILV